MLLPVPYSVDRKLAAAPYVSYALAAVNVVIYLVCIAIGAEAYREFVYWGGVIAGDLKAHALFTMHFIHDAPSPMHVAGNLLFLLLFGRHVEDAIGRVWFVLVYVLGGVAAAMIQTLSIFLFDRAGMDAPLIGASGAIAALMGVFAVRFYRTSIKVFYMVGIWPIFGRAGVWRPTSLLALGLWGGWELVQALFALGVSDVQEAGGVAHWAHLGGLVFGAVIAMGAGMHRHAQEMYTLKDAYEFFRNGQMKKSADCFSALLRETPDDPNMRHKLAVAFDLSQHHARALPQYVKAIELYAGRGNVADAARIFGQVGGDRWVAQRLDAEVSWLIGDYLAERGRTAEAYAAFAALAGSQPGKPAAENAAVRCGDLLLTRLNQPARAIEWYRGVRDRGKDQENVTRATRGLVDAERAAARLRAAQPPAPRA
ncbi:MAG: rhomboid family intramembrane serine protease [Armatimonadetes bacterium]|nr:rhomboid family intramembrane serine protease [Armatimonadota bacterium]